MIDNRPWLDFGYQFWRACSTQAPLHAISRDEKFGPDTMRLQRNVERNIERHEDIGARTRDDRFRNWGSSCWVRILFPLYSTGYGDEASFSLISLATVSNPFHIERNIKTT